MSYIFIGMPGSGKTYRMRTEVLKRRLPTLVISPNTDDKYPKDMLKPCMPLVKRKGELKEGQTRDHIPIIDAFIAKPGRKILVLDDVAPIYKGFKNDYFMMLFANRRHFNLDIYVSCQAVTMIIPAIRRCIDEAYIYRIVNEIEIRNCKTNWPVPDAIDLSKLDKYECLNVKVTGEYRLI